MVTVQCLIAPELQLLAEALWHLAFLEIVRQSSAIISAICARTGADGRGLTWVGGTYAFNAKQIFLLQVLSIRSRNPQQLVAGC